MKLNTKILMLGTVGALAAAVPAGAHPGGHPNGHGQGGGKGSHGCRPHNRAYVEAGTVDSTTPSTLAQNADGTWSGTLVVDVTRANHAARADEGQTVTYTFNSASLQVRFDGGTTALAAGERVRLMGKIAALAPRCTAPSSAPAPAFKRIVVHPAGSTESSGPDTSGSGSGTSAA